MTTYAINVGDLITLPEIERFMVGMLVEPVIQSGKTINIHPRKVNGTAILLECDEGRAQAIVDVIRMKIPKWRLHCYLKAHGKGWKSI